MVEAMKHKKQEEIPENERWLHTAEARARLDAALEWHYRHRQRESDLGELSRKILKGS